MNDDKSYKEYLADISTFIFDVDGVLTDGTITVTTEGEMLRTMSIKDGFALKTAIDAGYNLCIISGGSNEGIYSGNEYHFRLYAFPNKSLTDDIPDFPVMELVGLPCCPQDAVPEIKAISKYISHKNGGKGAVRDVIEQVLKVHGKWNGNFNAKYD